MAWYLFVTTQACLSSGCSITVRQRLVSETGAGGWGLQARRLRVP